MRQRESQGKFLRCAVQAAAVAMACILCCPAWADNTATDVPGLKSAVLELLQARAVPADPAQTLQLYIGNRDAQLTLDEITLRIDDAPPLRYQYADREALALHQGGLQRLLSVPLAPGRHRLRADFAARYTQAPPDHWRTAGTLSRELSLGGTPQAIELELVGGGYLSPSQLQWHELKPAEAVAAADQFTAGTTADPRLRYAAFLTASDRPLRAIEELYSLQAGAPAAAGTPDFHQRLAEALAAFGLEDRADALYKSPAADAAGATQAYGDYNRGLALLQQQHFAEAAAAFEALASSKDSGDPALAVLRDQAALQLGYALLRSHQGAAAIPWFSRVRSTGPCTNAALLGLGWALLAPSGDGRNLPQAANAVAGAGAPLPRIPVLLQPQLTPDIAALKRHEPYRPRQASAPEEQAVRRALVPWTELLGRDPLDPAVQEGVVAIPYALNHIGANAEALDYYQRAIRLLEALDAQLAQAQQGLAGGRLLQTLDRREAGSQGWPWWIGAYPKRHWWLAADPHQPLAAPEGFYLGQLMEQDEFRNAMQDYHDLHLLGEALDHAGGDNALKQSLLAAVAAQAGLLQTLAGKALREDQRRTEMYLAEARFSLAHVNEPPMQGALQ